MTVTVYGIPNCDQIRKTRRWLDLHGVDHRFHDYRSDGLDRATLEDWQARVGLSEVINTRSQTWRTLDEAQRKAVADVSTDAAYELLLAHPTLITKFGIMVIMQIYRLYFINKKIKFNRKEFVSYLMNISIVFALLLGLIYLSDTQRTYSFWTFVGEAVLLETILILVILFVGLNKAEKGFLFGYLKKRVTR